MSWNSIEKNESVTSSVFMITVIMFTGGNVFLSDDSIKLGDFGLSIQLRNLNKTAPQEIKDQRGTIRESYWQHWT